jgi:chromosome partitioning protein
LSVKGLQTIIDVIEETKEELNPNLKIEGFLITQANRTVVRKEMETLTREVYAGKVFETTIRQNVALEEAATQQMDIFSYSADSYGAEDYRKLAQEVLG